MFKHIVDKLRACALGFPDVRKGGNRQVYTVGDPFVPNGKGTMGVTHMIRAASAEARVFESWQDYQDALKRAIAPLTEEQLQRRLLPGLRTPGEIATHIVFGRAKWVHHALGEAAVELVPLIRWDDEAGAVSQSHTAAEILEGLDLTWRYIVACLMRGSPGDDLTEEDVAIRQSIWGMLDHDLPHAGELSLLLGAAGLPGVEI